MTIKYLGQKKDGTGAVYVPAGFYLMPASYMAIAGDFVRWYGYKGRDVRAASYIYESDTDDRSVAKLVWARNTQNKLEATTAYDRRGSDTLYPLVTGKYYWFGMGGSSSFYTSTDGAGSLNAFLSDVVPTALDELPPATWGADTQPTTRKLEVFCEVVNTNDILTQTLSAALTDVTSIVGGMSANYQADNAVVEYGEYSDRGALVSVAADGTFTVTEPDVSKSSNHLLKFRCSDDAGTTWTDWQLIEYDNLSYNPLSASLDNAVWSATSLKAGGVIDINLVEQEGLGSLPLNLEFESSNGDTLIATPDTWAPLQYSVQLPDNNIRALTLSKDGVQLLSVYPSIGVDFGLYTYDPAFVLTTTSKTIQGVSSSALLAGDSTLQASAPSRDYGEVLTVTTDGTFSFGSVAPLPIVLMTVEDQVVGNCDFTKIQKGVGVTIDAPAFNLEIVDRPDMPAGKAWKLGGGTAEQNSSAQVPIMYADHPAYTRIFESRVTVWPQEQQDASVEHFLSTYPAYTELSCGWQQKTIWHQSDRDYGATDTDFFWKDRYDFYDPTWLFKIHPYLSTNSISAQNSAAMDAANVPSVENVEDEYNRPHPTPSTISTLWDQGSADGVTADSTMDILTSQIGQGIQYNQRVNGFNLAVSTGPTKVINSFSYPGFVRGFQTVWNLNFFEGDMYQAGGDGAACQVVLSDNADYFLAERNTILWIDSWSDNTITAKLRGGWFDTNKLSGKFLNIIGANYTQIGSIAL